MTTSGRARVTTAVLVHGAWHGAWSFDRVVPLVRDAGIDVVTLDLPGHGDDAGPFTDLHGDADRVTRVLDAIDDDVVLARALVRRRGDHRRRCASPRPSPRVPVRVPARGARDVSERGGRRGGDRGHLPRGASGRRGRDRDRTTTAPRRSPPDGIVTCLYQDCDDATEAWARRARGAAAHGRARAVAAHGRVAIDTVHLRRVHRRHDGAPRPAAAARATVHRPRSSGRRAIRRSRPARSSWPTCSSISPGSVRDDSNPRGRNAMTLIDPTRTWSAVEARLATETDPTRRRNLAIVLEHMKAEAAGDLDGLMATVSEHAAYHAYGTTERAMNPVGKDEVRTFYENFIASGATRLQFEVDRLVVDDDCILTEGLMRMAYPGPHARGARCRGRRPRRVLPLRDPHGGPVAVRRRRASSSAKTRTRESTASRGSSPARSAPKTSPRDGRARDGRGRRARPRHRRRAAKGRRAHRRRRPGSAESRPVGP